MAFNYTRKCPNRKKRKDAFVVLNTACVDCGVVKSLSPNKRCRSCGRKNVLTAEVLKRMSIASVAKTKGCKLSQEHRLKLAAATKGKFGQESRRWVKDRTKLAKRQERNDSAYKDWRKSVRDRDGWKCKISNGDCLGKVVAHHILPWAKFPELRYETNNGITLCRFHHPRKREDEMKLSPYFQGLVSNNRN